MKKLLSFSINNHRLFNQKNLLDKYKKFRDESEKSLSNVMVNNEKNPKFNLLIMTMLEKNEKLLTNELYQKRLSDELNVFLNHKDDYILDLLFVYEDIAWFYEQRNEIANIGRGASVGSLSLFLLGITKIDPLKYNLLFDRFLDTNRTIDIDIDIFDKKELIEYLKNKYGSFFQNIKVRKKWTLKSALKTVAKELNNNRLKEFIDIIDKFQTIRVMNISDFNFKNENDFFDFICENDNLFMTFFKINPIYKEEIHRYLNSYQRDSIHAAGFILSDTDRTYFDEIENEEIVKIDLISMVSYSKIADCLTLKEFKSINFDLLNYNEIIYENKDEENNFFYSFIKNNPSSLDNLVDLAAIVAKNRPGCFMLIDNPIVTTNFGIESILKETKGQLIFQEQFMEILHKVFYVNKNETLKVLKKAAQKTEDSNIIFNELRGKFPELAVELNSLQILAPFLFLKAHAISYAMLSILKLRYT